MNRDLRNQLIEHEGLRLKPYRCTAGKVTIGVGRNLDDVGISREEALLLLAHDVKECEADLRRLLPSWLAYSLRRRHALIDMRLNLGPGRLRGFRRMLAAIRAGAWEAASDEAMDSKWARQVGRRAETIARMLREG